MIYGNAIFFIIKDVILLYLNKLKTICFPKEICEYGNYLITLHPVSRSNVISLKVKLKR